jgi:hypothetical protein
VHEVQGDRIYSTSAQLTLSNSGKPEFGQERAQQRASRVRPETVRLLRQLGDLAVPGAALRVVLAVVLEIKKFGGLRL